MHPAQKVADGGAVLGQRGREVLARRQRHQQRGLAGEAMDKIAGAVGARWRYRKPRLMQCRAQRRRIQKL
jgi:hypothetical protein